jgi:hypothetical protein
MGDLASRERELRARLNRQKGQPSGQGRDWWWWNRKVFICIKYI